ncbi:MAG TPA: 50S ribosomal protein L18 [Candidatus Thermoplasmatota archaeon]|nr:50S ribosomal protein L18 [Candidatus Thermoplasmatota archaeon]
MAHGPLYRVPFRRRREGKTDYRTRLALVKSGKTRAVVRQSLKNVTIQFVNFANGGDVVVAQAEARELAEHGWKGATANLPAAYLAGLLAGKRAKQAGIEDAVLDIGRAVPQKGGRLFAALKGLVESGINVPHGADVLPEDARARGEHLNKPEVAAAFATTYEKIVGKPLPPKKEAPKKKGGDKKGAAPAPAAKGNPAAGKGAKPAGEKKAKTPE